MYGRGPDDLCWKKVREECALLYPRIIKGAEVSQAKPHQIADPAIELPEHGSMHAYFGDAVLIRLLIQRGMAAVYLIGFVVVLRQFKPLLGERGLLPVAERLRGTGFRQRFAAAPGIFAWRYSDEMLDAVGWTGVAISALALLGVTE